MGELLQNQLDVLLPFIESGLLTVHHLSDTDYLEIEEWAVPNRLSFTDKTALFLAKTLSAMVLTGDNVFRKQALSFHLEAHGLLWILEQWVFMGRIKPKAARVLLEKLMLFNERLPQKECEDLLEKWEAQK